MPLNLVMLGAPAAGKGTQARVVAEAHGIPHIATGDMLREAVAAATPVGLAVKSVMDSGALVGDELIVDLVRERLARADTRDGFVLDGFPRTVAQAVALDGLVRGRGPLVVIDIVVPTEVLVKRACSRLICTACGTITNTSSATCPACHGSLTRRRDDCEDVVRERLRVYDQQTRPLIEFYGSRPTFHPVDGDNTPTAVEAAIREVVERFAAPANTSGAMAGRGPWPS